MAVLNATQHRRRVPSKARAGEALLAWYDVHRRDLPWRAKRGEANDPYRVWLSEIMLQQTTVVAVPPYYPEFLAPWPDVAPPPPARPEWRPPAPGGRSHVF